MKVKKNVSLSFKKNISSLCKIFTVYWMSYFYGILPESKNKTCIVHKKRIKLLYLFFLKIALSVLTQ